MKKIDRFLVLGPLGEGRMLRVLDPALGKVWAMKIIPRRQSSGFFCLRSIDHPAFPRIVEEIRKEEYIAAIEEYIPGETLAAVVAKNGLRPREAARIARDVAAALTYLHTCAPPILLRDLKNENILITKTGAVRLVDFDLAVRGEQHVSRVLGTSGYASPAFLKGEVSKRTDLFALGKCYENILPGIRRQGLLYLPADAMYLKEMRVLARALCKDTPPSAKAVVGRWDALARRIRRKRHVLGFAACLLALGLLFATVLAPFREAAVLAAREREERALLQLLGDEGYVSRMKALLEKRPQDDFDPGHRQIENAAISLLVGNRGDARNYLAEGMRRLAGEEKTYIRRVLASMARNDDLQKNSVFSAGETPVHATGETVTLYPGEAYVLPCLSYVWDDQTYAASSSDASIVAVDAAGRGVIAQSAGHAIVTVHMTNPDAIYSYAFTVAEDQSVSAAMQTQPAETPIELWPAEESAGLAAPAEESGQEDVPVQAEESRREDLPAQAEESTPAQTAESKTEKLPEGNATEEHTSKAKEKAENTEDKKEETAEKRRQGRTKLRMLQSAKETHVLAADARPLLVIAAYDGEKALDYRYTAAGIVLLRGDMINAADAGIFVTDLSGRLYMLPSFAHDKNCVLKSSYGKQAEKKEK